MTDRERELLEKLRIAEQRADESDRRADEERHRADEERHRADEERHRADEERHRADESDRRNQNTTFNEFLQACHIHMSMPLSIQTDLTLTTKGSTTSPKGKTCPRYLRPWKRFLNEQHKLLDSIQLLFYPDSPSPLREFPAALHWEEEGKTLCRRKLASEADLTTYERMAVEEQVSTIMSNMSTKDGAKRYKIAQGIVFDNHPGGLSDKGDDVREYLERLQIDKNKNRPPRKGRADQLCVYQQKNDVNTLLFVAEYKPAHKLPLTYLQGGLREMDLPAEVINRSTIPTDRDKKLDYNADRLVAMAVTQAFSYMMENGLEFSYLTTGQAFVFLQVKKGDPSTVYYHLAIPNEDAEMPRYDWRNTAIAQVLGLSLRALQSTTRTQNWRQKEIAKLGTWQEDFESILSKIPEQELRCDPPSAYKGSRGKSTIKRTYATRSKGPCGPDPVGGGRASPDDSDSDQDLQEAESPTQPSRRTCSKSASANQETKDKDKGKETGKVQGQTQAYCTQECLLSLARRLSVDNNCPNVASHQKRNGRHGIDSLQFLTLVRAQLAQDLDHNCQPLGRKKQGARGALFKVTLASHGYVFVAKGTVEAFKADLVHERQVYRRINKIQGTAVPVCMGSIDLKYCYYLDFGVRIVHMLLMSWGGEQLTTETAEGLWPAIHQTAARIQALGVDQADLRLPNVLWNEEGKRVLIIDFERAKYIKIVKPGKGSRVVAAAKGKDDTKGKEAMADNEVTKRTETTKAKEHKVMQEMSPNKRHKRMPSPSPKVKQFKSAKELEEGQTEMMAM